MVQYFIIESSFLLLLLLLFLSLSCSIDLLRKTTKIIENMIFPLIFGFTENMIFPSNPQNQENMIFTLRVLTKMLFFMQCSITVH